MQIHNKTGLKMKPAFSEVKLPGIYSREIKANILRETDCRFLLATSTNNSYIIMYFTERHELSHLYPIKYLYSIRCKTSLWIAGLGSSASMFYVNNKFLLLSRSFTLNEKVLWHYKMFQIADIMRLDWLLFGFLLQN